MSQNEPKIEKRPFVILLIFFLILAVFFYFFPEKLNSTLKNSWDSLSQFLLILPAVVLLIGILSVTITLDTVKKNFGTGTGFEGAMKALFFGSVFSVGPFYLSFPIAKNLLDKGARIATVVIFVCAWNGIGLIAEILELHFLGWQFMITRFLLTSIFIVITGYVTESLVKKIKI